MHVQLCYIIQRQSYHKQSLMISNMVSLLPTPVKVMCDKKYQQSPVLDTVKVVSFF